MPVIHLPLGVSESFIVYRVHKEPENQSSWVPAISTTMNSFAQII